MQTKVRVNKKAWRVLVQDDQQLYKITIAKEEG